MPLAGEQRSHRLTRSSLPATLIIGAYVSPQPPVTQKPRRRLRQYPDGIKPLKQLQQLKKRPQPSDRPARISGQQFRLDGFTKRLPQLKTQLPSSDRPARFDDQRLRRSTVASNSATPSAPRTLRVGGLVRYLSHETVLIVAPEQWPEGDCEPPYATVIRQHVDDGTCDVRLLYDLDVVVPRALVRPVDITLDSKTLACVRSYDNGDPDPAVLAEQWGYPRFATHDIVTTVGTVQCDRWPAPSDEEHVGAVIEQRSDGTCDIRLLCDPELTILRARVRPAMITLDRLDIQTRTRILQYDDYADDLLVLPDIVQRIVDLYLAGLICEPSDLLVQSDVCGRDFGLAHLACFAFMKQRGHVDHMRASEAYPPTGLHPQYADDSKLARHHRSWLRGNSWALAPPPDVPNAALDSRVAALRFTHWCCDAAVAAPPSRTFVPRTTGPHRFVGSFLDCLEQPDRRDRKHPCRSSSQPPRPYLDRHTGRPYDPDRLTHAGIKRMRAVLRAIKPLADDFDGLSVETAVTFRGRRTWLRNITRRLSSVSGLGGNYVSPRVSRSIMNVFGPIDSGEWHNRTWRDVLDVAVDAGDHLKVGKDPGAASLFPLDTSASAIAARLPFPLEFLSMYICIESGDLQADISGSLCVGVPIRNGRAHLSFSKNSVPPTKTPQHIRHFFSRHATSIAMSRALTSSADADGPAVFAENRHSQRPSAAELHARRHQNLLASVADPNAYALSTCRLQRDFLNLLADRRPVSRSEARRLCQPFYALTFPYQAHECREAVHVFSRRLDRLVNSTPGGLCEVLPDFLSGGITDRPNSTTDAAYHVLLGAKYVGQRCHRGAAIAMGVGRDKRSCFQHSNGLSSTFSMAFEHAFLEDVCRPPTRLFADAVSCDTYDSVHTQSYAGRAFLPCIERDDTERRKAIRAVRRRHSPYLARRALAVLASAGAIHVPPDVRHDDLIQEARMDGVAVGSLNSAELCRCWILTHPTPTAIGQPDVPPPDLLIRLFVWIENPGASALFRWLLPRLYEYYGIDLRNVTHVARLTHCFGGGAAWRKYTRILSSDETLVDRIGVCGPCPALNCGHAKRHEVTFAGNTSLPADAINIKHSIPPRLYDAQMAPLARAIPRSIRHQYLVVHLGSGSQSSRHITTLGFPVAFVDYVHTVTTNFRSLSPTLCTDYDDSPEHCARRRARCPTCRLPP